MKKYFFIAALLLLTGNIIGCTQIVAGMRMDTDTPSVPGLTITPITADTLRTKINKPPEKPAIKSSKASPGSEPSYQYRIGPHDVLAIIVWGHYELTLPAGEYRTAEAGGNLVAEDGTIFFPYVGTIHVAGKTAADVRQILTEKVAKVIQDPQIDVKVVSFRSQKVYVSGEVSKPGAVSITDVPMTVAEAISLAGNFTPEADLSNVTLTHNDKATKIDLLDMYDNGDMRQNVLLANGDMLHVPDRSAKKVFVIGEVTKPTSIMVNNRGITLTEALSDAGGVNPRTSSPGHIYVIRGDGDKSEVFHLAAGSPDALILGDQFRLKPHDVVYVEATDLTRYGRTMDNLLSTAALLRGVGAVGSFAKQP
jgi:polysaccharide biosynthesis/export protein